MSKKRSKRSARAIPSSAVGTSEGRNHSVWMKLLRCSFPGLVAFVVWSGSLYNGFVWDDRNLIVENSRLVRPGAVLTAFSGDFWDFSDAEGRTNYYRPLVTVSYILDRMVFGLHPWGFHLTNLLIHAVNCSLLMVLLGILGLSPSLSLLCASLFAIHPALGETVAWISGRTDSLAVMWMLLAVIAGRLAYSRSASKLRWRWIAACSFALALCSKEIAIVTPCISYVLARAVGERNPARNAFAPIMLIVFIGWCVVRAIVLHGRLTPIDSAGMDLSTRFIGLLHVMGNLVWPAFFRIEYGATVTTRNLLAGALAGLALAVIAIIHAGQARRLEAGAIESRLSAWLAIVGCIMCLPAAMAVYVKGVVGTRLVYGPAVFIIPAVVLAFRTRCSTRVFLPAVCIVAAMIAPYAVVRSSLWRSDITLFEEALKAPNFSTRVHLNYGIALYDAARFKEAKFHLDRDIEMAARVKQEYMLGLFYTVIACESKAEVHYQQSRRLNPAGIPATTNLVGLYTTQGRRQDAIGVISHLAAQRGIRRDVVQSIRVNMEHSMASTERKPQDREWCHSDAEIDSFLSSATLLDARGLELVRAGQLEMGALLLRAAYRLEPMSEVIAGHHAQVLLRLGKRDEAKEIIFDLVRRYPNKPDVQHLLSLL